MLRPLRIAVDARIPPGVSGGVEQVIRGLASGLSSLRDSEDEYLFLVHDGEGAWLAPHLSGPTRLHEIGRRDVLERWRPRLAQLPFARRAFRTLRAALPRADEVVLPPEPRGLGALGLDVIHFPVQAAFLTGVPSIYHPHDMQHRHLPDFFTPEVLRWREAAYASFAGQAAIVAVASEWTRQDVIRELGLAPGKVRVVPLAPLGTQAGRVDPSVADSLRSRLRIPAEYAFFPSQTWPHKNHIGLLHALAELRDRQGLRVPLVCSGFQNEHFAVIEAEVRRLGLEAQVSFVGHVDAETLRALYAGARLVVVPTRFEAGSFPVWEAFLSEVPVACSNVTSLPEQAGDAALLFAPDDLGAMADAIHRLWTEPELRKTLVARGRAKVAPFTWERTAREFSQLYRELAVQDREPSRS